MVVPLLQFKAAEVVMASVERQALVSAYGVEVSGWDKWNTFFVEKAELLWSEGAGKQLTLSRKLSPGATIFVRLLQPTDVERSFPVAYEAEPISTALQGPYQFRLKRIVPRSVQN